MLTARAYQFRSLVDAAADVGCPWHMGIVHSKDSFFGLKEPERMPVADLLQSRWKAWVHGGALLSEIETATLFVLASLYGVRSGSICVVGANDFHRVNLQEGEERESAIERVITASLGAVHRLATSEVGKPIVYFFFLEPWFRPRRVNFLPTEKCPLVKTAPEAL